MRVLVLCLLATLAAVTAAQTGKPAPKPAAPASRPPAPARPATAAAPARFSAAGLNNEDDFLRIYSGDFQSVRLDPASTEFMMIISSYMNDYSTACKQFLPPDKVEITEQVCAGSTTSSTYSPDGVHDIYGNPIAPSTCVYETVGTGRYADPQLYAAEQAADAAAAKKMLGGMLGMLTGKGGGGDSNPLTMPQQLTDQITAVGTEMQTLIHTNACGSPGLRNFQSNLIRFTNGDQPVEYAGAVASAPTAPPGEPAKDTNFARLLDDLVADNARGWMMNRYQPGSISDPIVSRDPSGRPVRVIAQYSYTGMQGAQRGRVTVSFKDGSPDCLYFSDNPDSCRLPAAGVVSAYEKNAYAK